MKPSDPYFETQTASCIVPELLHLSPSRGSNHTSSLFAFEHLQSRQQTPVFVRVGVALSVCWSIFRVVRGLTQQSENNAGG